MTDTATDVKRHILIVDDEEMLALSIVKMLSQASAHNIVKHAKSAEDAVKLLDSGPCDLVVTDIRMPGMNGIDLLRVIRNTHPDTGVIIMTAFGSTAVQEEASRRGSLLYIEKPFDFENLRSVIDEFFRKKESIVPGTATKDDETFTGNMGGIQLMDVVQMNCLGRMTCTMHIKDSSGKKEGIICFNKGDITHAETPEKSGKEAFFEIASWKGGNFETLDDVPPTVTITDNWEMLLMESLELSSDEPDTAPTKPAAKKPVKPTVEEKPAEDPSKMLDRILSSVKADAVYIITLDGFVIDKRLSNANIDLNKSGTEISATLPPILSLGKMIGAGALAELNFRYKEKFIMIRNIVEHELLFIVIAPSAVASGEVYKAVERESVHLKSIL
jgi:CheY-like chemotaxis protein